MIKRLTALTTRSGLNILMRSKALNLSSFVFSLQPHGRSASSGYSRSYQRFHCYSLSLMSSHKSFHVPPNSFSLQASFQPFVDIHLNGFPSTASSEVFPLRKKSSSYLLSSSSPSIIIVVIQKENISLCFSNIPMHVNSQTSWVNFSMMNLSLACKTGSFFEVSIAFMKTVRYMSREFSYMSEIAERPVNAKKRTAPRFATGLYDSLFCSISAVVTLAFSRASPIETDFSLASSRTFIRGSLSTRGTSVSFASSLNRISSNSLSYDLFSDVSLMSF